MARRFVNIGIDGERQMTMVVKRGKVFGHIVAFTTSCSGCFEGGECMGLAHNYPYDSKAQCYVGAGCDECGYTGKRRIIVWVPLPIEIQQQLLRERAGAK